MPKVSELKHLYDNHVNGTEFLSKLPPSVRAAFFDNEYTCHLKRNVDFLIELHFEEHRDTVEWLLYEWKRGFEVSADGDCSTINTPQDYYDHLIKYEGWEY